MYILILHCFCLGITKPASVEQPELIAIVLGFVQNFVPDFSAADIIWVRSMRTSKFGVLNVQCRSVVMASRVRSTFALLVKTTPVPVFIGKVKIIIIMFRVHKLIRKNFLLVY